jgi:hypothetical protein
MDLFGVSVRSAVMSRAASRSPLGSPATTNTYAPQRLVRCLQRAC